MTLILYSRANTWLTQNEKREVDRPLHSFARLMVLSVKGRWLCLRYFGSEEEDPGGGKGFGGRFCSRNAALFLLREHVGPFTPKMPSPLTRLLQRRISARDPSTPPSPSKT